MAYTALYRVWRPQTFGDIVGQSHVTITLRNALREGRLSHAYLFNGPRGTGKTSAAKIMAKAVNCERPQDGEPCNECKTCQAITSGRVTDVLEIDAASNRGVEEIRDIRDKVKFAPSDARYKVYIIDEVHMLTTEAFNALLKTLEEPPPHVLFILATTEPHKLPATIISRCQRFDFHRIPLEEMVARLRQICEAQQVEVEEGALQLVAKMAEGGMRDALSLLDQAISYCGSKVELSAILQITGSVAQTFFSTMAASIAESNVSSVLEQFQQLMQQGKDPEQFLHDLLYYYRDMLLLKTAPQLDEIVERTLIDDRFASVAEGYDLPRLYEIIESLNEAMGRLKYSSHARVLAELTLVRLCHVNGSQLHLRPSANSAQAIDDALEQRLRMLEDRVARLMRGEMAGAPTAASVREEGKPRESIRTASVQNHRVSLQKLSQIARDADPALTQKVKGSWAQILETLRSIKVQYRAWLVSGQPEVVGRGTLVVTFKSPIHCDKTMEPELKGIVERVLADVTGAELQLLSVMEEQWQEAEQSDIRPDDREPSSEEDPLVAEAFRLVGEHLVEIKE